MFREMRRKNQLLSEEETKEILRLGTSGVLAVSGDNGYPYAVPLSYVYTNGKIYFHCARSGHKLDALRNDPKASFCVIGRDNVVKEEYTTYFKSAIVFGKIRVMNESEKRTAIEILAEKYYPDDSAEHRNKMIEAEYAPLCMLEMTIEHMSGKAAKELIK